MSEMNFTKPVIFCANFDVKGLGVYTNGDNTFCVEVYRMEGRTTYTYKLNGVCSHMSRTTATEAWELAGEHVNADLITVCRKWLNKSFKKEIKDYKESKSV